ncbi:MAG: AI-2E family transporter [Porticoccaceae bacterium]|nr:AI-2E family transporter [Porticoccaceae bacterium]
MLKVVGNWIDRYLGDEEAVLLTLLMGLTLALLVYLGEVLAPFFAALIIAFLLQGGVTKLQRLKVPRFVAVLIMFLVFIGIVVIALVGLVPIIIQQSTNLVAQMPGMVKQLQSAILLIPEQYPEFISEPQLRELIGYASREAARLGETLLTFSFSSLPNIVGLLVYLILVPLMVFFMLNDKERLIETFTRLLPSKRPVMRQIWHEMNLQTANYVRGKAMEIVIVGATSYIAFLVLGLDYAALLALLVGLSVLIPYIGAAVVTIPVLVVGYFQWGWGNEFIWLAVVYGVIQFLDGNVLVPLLFSEAVNLHPLVIILAVLVFGGLWGFWGVFFAIPLATLIKAMYSAWPRKDNIRNEMTES